MGVSAARVLSILGSRGRSERETEFNPGDYRVIAAGRSCSSEIVPDKIQ